MTQPIGWYLVFRLPQFLIVSFVALLSVYDKTNLLDLAKGLHDKGLRLLGSGGTAKKIRDAGIPIEFVSVHMHTYADILQGCFGYHQGPRDAKR